MRLPRSLVTLLLCSALLVSCIRAGFNDDSEAEKPGDGAADLPLTDARPADGDAAPLDLPVEGPPPEDSAADTLPPAAKTHWVEVSSASTSPQRGVDVAVDPQGNVFVVGEYRVTTTFGNTQLQAKGSGDIIVASFDKSGKPRWVKGYGSPGEDRAYGVGLDSAGNVYVVGEYSGSTTIGTVELSPFGGQDIFVASFTNTGQPRWTKGFGSVAGDRGYAVAFSAGRVYVTGYVGGTVTLGAKQLFTNGLSDVLLLGLNASNGALVWGKVVGSSGPDIGVGLAAGGGQVYVTGAFNGMTGFGCSLALTSQGEDAFLLSYDSTGTCKWVKHFTGSGHARGAALTLGGGRILLAGRFSDTINFGGSNLTSKGKTDGVIASYDAIDGKHRWSVPFGGTLTDEAYDVTVDSLGRVSACGRFQGTAGVGKVGYLSKGGDDGFVARFDPSGALMRGRQLGGTLNDSAFGVAADSAGDLRVTGYYQGTADFGTGPKTANSGEIFLLSLTP